MNLEFIFVRLRFLSTYFFVLIGYDFELRALVLETKYRLSSTVSLENLLFSVPLVSQMWMIAYVFLSKSIDFEGFQLF